ncbi:MAG: VanZ family protein [Candidatus Portnoybacteria bacterium]
MKKTKNWILVILWAGVIFFFSHQPDLKSDLPNQWDFILRKLAHIAEYAVLTFLLVRALGNYQINKSKLILWSFFLAILYAVSDEYHQTFILGREGAIRDVLIDSIGVVLACFFAVFRYNKE